MRVLVLLLVASLPSCSSKALSVSCSVDSDCSSGETCVAGESPHPIQACVAGAVCGGWSAGNCPSDSTSGQLACIAHQGVHKCVSAHRCDQYFGSATCSGGCNGDDGVLCNANGFCSILSTDTDGRPTFGCTCNDGYSGDKCESSATFPLDSWPPESEGSRDSSPSRSSDETASEDSQVPARGSAESTSEDSQVPARGSAESTIPASSADATPESNSNVVPESTIIRPSSSQSDAKGTSSAVFITIGILAACIFIGALLFAMYSRKKKREGAQADGFGGTAAFVAPAATVESDLEGGSGHDTPKSSIVTM